VTLDQSLELQLFYRDCQNADNQMAKQEVRPCSCPFIESEGGSSQSENALRISVTVVLSVNTFFRISCQMKMLETLLMQLMR
jgi:hypothetical protein